jgi:hypothetical protein
MDMVIVWALSWWYGAGWKMRFIVLRSQLASSYDYFSIGLLTTSLFAPYRQISAGKVNGPVAIQFRAFVDRQISRVIGAVVRTILITAGLIWLLIQVLMGAAVIAAWLVIPFLPLIGFIMTLSGWVPQWK